MPAYNYYPNNYQPYSANYFQGYQPQMVQPQQIVPAAPTVQPTQSSIIWISGDKEAAMYPVAPNNAVTLWSQSEPVVYLKQADASGKPTMHIYDLVERTEQTASHSDGTDYATKSDLATVAGIVKDLDGIINTLKTDVDSMKTDIYGLSGRRKSGKKTEDDE